MSLTVNLDVVPSGCRNSSRSVLELQPDDSVSDAIETLQSHRSKRTWSLVETWHGCKRQVGHEEDVFDLRNQWGSSSDIRLQLAEQPPTSFQSARKVKAKRTRMKGALLSQPRHFLRQNKLTHKRLHCTKWVMDQALRQSRKRYSNMLLSRIVRKEPLWGPLESTPLDSLQAELSARKASNLHLSSEIADLNIESTRLRNQTHPLRQKEQELQKKLSQLQKEVTVKRQEKDRRGPRDLSQVQTDIIKLRRELETRNRLNASHTAKLKAQKDLLAEKRAILSEKLRELENLKTHPPPPLSASVQLLRQREEKPGTQNLLKLGVDEPNYSEAAHVRASESTVPTPSDSRQEVKATLTSSTSKKRHASKFEAKTKQLIEEEGLSFRKMQSKHRHDDETPSSGMPGHLKFEFDTGDEDLLPSTDLETYKKYALNLNVEGPDVLIVPVEDARWYESQTSEEAVYEESPHFPLSSELLAKQQVHIAAHDAKKNTSSSSSCAIKEKRKRRQGLREVRFVKEALILNAALEGDLELLKECVKELGSCAITSDKGATCLHNAVCSGNMEMVKYLVEMGCDVNAQDIDGWTPLHCAAAYHNLDVIHYLVQNGSSLFLATQDGDTPLKIAIEEYEVERQSQPDESKGKGEDEKAKGNSQMAVEYLHYLMDIQTNLGVANQGQVFVLFSRTSSEADELSVSKGECLIITDRGGRGEQWWMAKNMSGQRGLVPCTFLGPYYSHCAFL